MANVTPGDSMDVFASEADRARFNDCFAFIQEVKGRLEPGLYQTFLEAFNNANAFTNPDAVEPEEVMKQKIAMVREEVGKLLQGHDDLLARLDTVLEVKQVVKEDEKLVAA